MARRFDFEANHWMEEGFLSVPGRKPASSSELSAPETAPTPGRWHRAAEPTRKIDPALAATVGLYLVYVACLGVLSEKARIVGFALIAVVGLIQVIRISRKGELSDADQRLLEHPDDPDVCLVEIRIVRDGRTLGKDRGAAWFEKGRLIYCGHRTSFALGGEDVRPQSDWHVYHVGQDFQYGLPEVALPLRTSDALRYVAFTPLPRQDPVGLDQSNRFRYRLSRFRRLPPKSEGPRQWPPFEA